MSKQSVFMYVSLAIALVSLVMSIVQALKKPKVLSSWTGTITYGLYSLWGIWVIFF